MSFVALKATGRTRFTTGMATFDRAFPGTFLQRIKEVRVEVLVAGAPATARGYLAGAPASRRDTPRYRSPSGAPAGRPGA